MVVERVEKQLTYPTCVVSASPNLELGHIGGRQGLVTLYQC